MTVLTIGVDVGGTFTDIFVLDEAAGIARIAKVPTSRPDQSAGFQVGNGVHVDDLSRIAVVVDGTTAGTNALLERKGARIGVINPCAMLREVGIGRAIVPRYPGVTSAMGCVIADMRQDFVQTVNVLADAVDPAALGAVIQRHHDDGMAMLDAARTPFEARDVVVELDMAYLGQTHTVAVPLPVTLSGGTIKPPTRDQITAAFDAAYRATYGRLLERGVRRVINLRTAVIGRRPRFDLATLAPDGTGSAAPKARRQVHFGDAWHDTGIYDRLPLPVGTEITGPAILEQPDTAILIEPGLIGTVDPFGNVLITRQS